MSGREISAIKIKKLRYAEPLGAEPTEEGIKAAFDAATKITNSHQGTFQYEEAEAAVDKYKNQLTGQIYRSNVEPGDVKISFAIGKYDFQTKADLQGGTATATSWKRGKAAQIHKALYAVTEDDVCIIFPNANIIGTGKSTDDAIAIGIQAIPEEGSSGIGSEYWFDVADKALQD